jgi:ubiquinone/menaquinone biosynthesis C-methylase UbiE
MTEPIDAKYYDEVIGRESAETAKAVVDSVFRRMRKLRAPEPGATVLDIGCGTGVITAAAADLGLEAVGLDVVPEFVEAARERHPGASFEVGPSEQLPFPDESFDYVLLLSLLEHVQDWERTLAEAVRVLRPGGVMYLTTTNRFCPKQYEIRYLWGFGYLPGRVQRKIYSLSMEHWPKLVNYTHLPAYHWFWYGQLAERLGALGVEPHHGLSVLGPQDIPARYRSKPLRKAIELLIAHPLPWSYLFHPTTTVLSQKPAR